MRIVFPYQEMPTLEVPDGNLLGEFRPRELPERPPIARQVESALRAPIDSPGLGALVGPGRKVLLLVDDYTRPTPVADLLPVVLAELREAGVGQSDITFLTAPGTHRPMSEQELARKLGPDVLRQYAVDQHRWQDERELARAGETSDGLPIIVNRRLLEADLVVALGHIVPHRVTGFSGGAKIVDPGVFGEPPSTQEMHWLSAQVPGREILGVVDNPIRRAIDEMAGPVGLRFIVNVVQDANGRLGGVFAGDPIAAHREGIKLSREIYGVQLPALADIVVIGSYPADVDFWQAGKAAYASELAVRPGGIVILVTPSPEGVARHHPAVLEHGVRPVAELQRMVERGEIKDIVAAAILALTAWVVKERATGIMVSPGIPAEEKQRIGFLHAETPQAALEMAFQRMGSDARLAVLQHGGEILPLAPAGLEAETRERERIAVSR